MDESNIQTGKEGHNICLCSALKNFGLKACKVWNPRLLNTEWAWLFFINRRLIWLRNHACWKSGDSSVILRPILLWSVNSASLDSTLKKSAFSKVKITGISILNGAQFKGSLIVIPTLPTLQRWLSRRLVVWICSLIYGQHIYFLLRLFLEVTQEEMEFPIAFALMVHDQITLFETLLATLFRPHNAYCVFMDGKADPGFKAQIHLLINCYKSRFPNVR